MTICDDEGLELPPRTIKVAIKWLVWQHKMTEQEATATMIDPGRGHIRQRKRKEAIDVADFMEHQG